MAGDVEKSTVAGADEVIGDHWPTDSESDIADMEKHMMDWARAHDHNQKVMTDARDYAQNEMDGDFADAAAAKFGYHAQVFADKQQAHLYTSGWLAVYAMAVTTAKHAMNAAAETHAPDHIAFQQFDGIIGNAKQQHDASKNTAQNAVAAADDNLKNAKVQVHLGISSGLKPPMVPALGSGDKPKESNPGSKDQAPAPNLPPDATKTAPDPYSPQNTNPALTPAAPGGPSAPAGPAAPSAPSLPASPLGAPGGGAPSAGGPAAPSMPRLGDPVAGAGAGAPGGGSPMGMGGSPMGMGMPMGGSPMGGMQPPQMPQIPSQTPGGDIAKTIGDTVGKLAGGQHNGQPVSAETLGKLLDAQNGGGAGGPGSGGPGGPGAGGPGGPGDPGSGGGLADGKGLKPDGSTLAGDDKKGLGLGKHHALDPYSAANTNPALNDPPAPTSGPMAGPSPASPVITPTPGAGAAPMTHLSADESIPPPAATHPAGTGDVTTHTSAVDAVYTDPSHPHGGVNGAPAGAPFGQQPVNSNGNALGAYPLSDGGGAAPMPAPAAPQAAPMAGGMPMAAGMGAAGGAAAATPPVILSTKTEASSGEGRRSSLEADPNAAATVEKTRPLPPEYTVAHEHLAGVAKAFRLRPEIQWTSVGLAVGVFLYEEVGLPDLKLRYILATSDALSLIPVDVQLPAGIELLGGELEPGRWLPRSFAGDWNGHERPALKIAAAADAHAPLLGRLVYLVSNDTDENLTPAVAQSSGVSERQAPRTQLQALEASGNASATRLSRVNVDAPQQITPDQAARYLAAMGHRWGFDDGSPDDLKLATSTLWAMRWGGNERRLQRPDDYVGTLATYWYVEGVNAVAAGRLDDAAYAAWQFYRLDPTGSAVKRR